jgi:predicted acyltransferase
MLLVNNAGDWDHVFPPLLHAEWQGCTATDLVFPFFLFIMGVAMTFSFARRLQEADGRRKLLPQILRRAAILIGLGLLLNLEVHLATKDLSWGSPGYRIPGVLQRIGLCYLFASLIVLWTGIRGQVLWTVGILLFYYALMKFIPVPGYGAGDLSKEGNLSTYLDTLILGSHAHDRVQGLYPHHDPEGLLSTIPAIASVLMGILAGHWIRDKKRDGNEKVAGLSVAGLGLFIVAALWKYDFPFSKRIWTSSYVVHTSALALLTLAALYWIIDVKGVKAWSKPFVVYGTNAIAAYFGASAMAYSTIWIRWTTETGESMYLKTWIYNTFYASWIPDVFSATVSSAAYGATYVVLWCALMWILYRKRIFLKV